MSCEKAAYCVIWFLMTIGTTLLVTCTVTSHWRGSGGSGDFHEGIFESCTPDCKFLKFFKGDDETEASRLLMIAGVAFLAIAMFLNIISPCVKKNIFFALAVIDTIAFLCCTAGLSLYTYHYKDINDLTNYSWRWSFIIGWTGCGIFGLGLIILCIVSCLDTEDK